MKTKMVPANPAHEAFYQDVCVVLKKYEDQGTPPIELLAMTANLIGKQLALLDQREYTAEEAMEVVSSNLELGNQQILNELLGKTAGTA